MSRPSWDEYFMMLAKLTASRSTCLSRPTGAVVVKDRQVIASGYNGSLPGEAHCMDDGQCFRRSLEWPEAMKYDMCRSAHAEANAIISASRRDMVGGTLYLVGRNAQTGELLPYATSCPMCRRHIINAGLERVVIRRTPTEFQVVDVQDWIDSEDDAPQA